MLGLALDKLEGNINTFMLVLGRALRNVFQITSAISALLQNVMEGKTLTLMLGCALKSVCKTTNWNVKEIFRDNNVNVRLWVVL